jgi:hypothetical protein
MSPDQARHNFRPPQAQVELIWVPNLGDDTVSVIDHTGTDSG